MNSFPYLPDLSFTFSIRFLILFQSSVYFVHTSLFLSLETKVKYLSPLLSSIYPSALLITRYIKDFHYEYLDDQDLYL